jgi:hypothetical protein
VFSCIGAYSQTNSAFPVFLLLLGAVILPNARRRGDDAFRDAQ